MRTRRVLAAVLLMCCGSTCCVAPPLSCAAVHGSDAGQQLLAEARTDAAAAYVTALRRELHLMPEVRNVCLSAVARPALTPRTSAEVRGAPHRRTAAACVVGAGRAV